MDLKPVDNLLKSLVTSTLILSLFACQSEQTHSISESSESNPIQKEEIKPLQTPDSQELKKFQNSDLTHAMNRFSLSFFQKLSANQQKNIISSPLSAAIALSMTYNGASGSTAEAMARTLKIQGLPLEQINPLFLTLRKQLTQNKEVELKLANGLWGKEGLTFDPDFIKNNTNYFGAEVSELDFGKKGAHQIINQWVEDKTQNKINHLVKADDFSPLTILVLVNAIYFKGLWSQTFKTENTRPVLFTHSDQSQTETQTMHLSAKTPYLQGTDFEAVALSYGKQEKNLRMYLFRPNDSIALSDWVKKLEASNLENWLQNFQEQQVNLALPRFKTEFEIELKKLLSDMGMGIAFDSDQADFSAMLAQGSDAYLSKVRQKAFIEVNEEGSEAAAATSVQVNLRSMPMERPFNIQFNRPFFYLIHEEATNSILFMGSTERPEN